MLILFRSIAKSGWDTGHGGAPRLVSHQPQYGEQNSIFKQFLSKIFL